MNTVVTIENIEIRGLPRRQAETLGWTALGLSSKEAARRMGISHRTVEMNLKHTSLRLDARNRTHLITQAIMAGMLAVRDTAAAVVVASVLCLASLPARDLEQVDLARMQSRTLRVRNRREDLIDNLLPLAA